MAFQPAGGMPLVADGHGGCRPSMIFTTRSSPMHSVPATWPCSESRWRRSPQYSTPSFVNPALIRRGRPDRRSSSLTPRLTPTPIASEPAGANPRLSVAAMGVAQMPDRCLTTSHFPKRLIRVSPSAQDDKWPLACRDEVISISCRSRDWADGMAATATSTTEARSNRLQIGNTGEIVPIRLHQRAKFTVIGLDGDVDIQAAVELKGILLSALLSQQELRIELAELTTLDVTVVQLLWATQHAAATTGTQVILDGPFPEGVKQAMDFANIERAPVNSK